MSLFPALVLTLFAAAPTQVATSAEMPRGDALEAVIADHDARLFAILFSGCDPEGAAKMLDPDFAMVHDLGGLVADNAEKFIADYARECTKSQPGGEYASYAKRRAIVPGSRSVRPMGSWGAMEQAYHVFFEKNGDGPEVMVGGAQYIHMWRWTGTEFRLTRSYSYDHGSYDHGSYDHGAVQAE